MWLLKLIIVRIHVTWLLTLIIVRIHVTSWSFLHFTFRLVLQHMEGIQALFMTEDVALPTSKDSSFTASQIALVVLAAVILVGGVLVVYVIFKTRTKYVIPISSNLYIYCSYYSKSEIRKYVINVLSCHLFKSEDG